MKPTKSTTIIIIKPVERLKAYHTSYTSTLMKEMNPHLTDRGSNPSPGAHLGEVSACFKAHGYWSKAAVACLGEGRRQTDATPLLNNRLSNTANRRPEQNHHLELLLK